MAIQGSIVLEFGEGVSDDSFVVIELDDQLNVDSQGNIITTFLPQGETASFIVHFYENLLRVGSVAASSGSVSGGTRVTRSKELPVEFKNNEDKVTLSYIPDGAVSFDWYAEGRGNSPSIDVDDREMLAIGSTPAIGNASFNIIARAYTLSPPDGLEVDEDETYPILCRVTMEAA